MWVFYHLQVDCYFYFYFNFLKMVTHSAKLVYKGPSTYKIKAKNLWKKKEKSTCLKSLHLQVYKTRYI